MQQIEIFYFSGTGNSLFIARELQKRMDGVILTPIVGLMDQKCIQSKAKIVGFVFPVHALTIPVVVKRFIKKIDFGSSEYLFAVATRFGSVFRGFKKINRLLSKKRKRLNAHFIINMGNNEARHKSYIVPSEADLLSMKNKALNKLEYIKTVIEQRRTCCPDDTEYTIRISRNPFMNLLMERIVLLGMKVSEHIGGVQYFYTDSKCNGCGICEKVCLSRKITMLEDKPVWQKKVFCHMCFACLNYCPRQSVQISDIPAVPSYTVENGRYPHPYATVKDIAGQKVTSYGNAV